MDPYDNTHEDLLNNQNRNIIDNEQINPLPPSMSAFHDQQQINYEEQSIDDFDIYQHHQQHHQQQHHQQHQQQPLWSTDDIIAEEMNPQDLIVGEAKYEQSQEAVIGQISSSEDDDDLARESPEFKYHTANVNQQNIDLFSQGANIMVEKQPPQVEEKFIQQVSGKELMMENKEKETEIGDIFGKKPLYEIDQEDPFRTPEKKRVEQQQIETKLFETRESKGNHDDKDMSDLLNFESSSSLSQFDIISHVKKSDNNFDHSHGYSDDEGILGDVGEPVVASLVSHDKLSATAQTAQTTQTTQSTIAHNIAFANQDSTKNISLEQTIQHIPTPNLDYQINTSSQVNTSQQEKRPKQQIQDKELNQESEFEINRHEQGLTTKSFESTMAQQSQSTPSSTTNDQTSSCPFAPSAWFNPDQLHPVVCELVYWRDPKKSGVVFGSGLIILLSLIYFSIISVVAYTSLAALAVTLSFRIYKNILQAVQKTNEGHPFKEYLDVPITPSPERVHQIVDVLLKHFDCTVNKLRSVFLVEDIIDSIKFVILFWCLTYVGSWFNGLTLVILAYLGLFSLPKVYEMHKAQIDQYLNLACTQIHDIVSKVRAKLPFPAKKDKDQ